MSEVKQYAKRDIMALDEAGNHYIRHVDHMTREKLHSKSDIAAELGWRDMQIAEIKAQRDALAAENAALREFMLECCVVECDDGYGVIELPAEGFFPKTINTDAYLNSVRAEGVEMLANKMQQTIDNAKLNSDEIGALAGAIFTGAAIAAQLRAGEPS